MIFKIARTELRNLFYSPVAWFLTIVFLVQCAVFYTNAIYPQAKMQDMLMANRPHFRDLGTSLTSLIFLGADGIFSSVLQNLYLFIPLLTMGLISREVYSGTIRLLYSSPVNIRQVVFGKYLAIMLYNLFLVLIVGVFMVMSAFQIRALDYGTLVSAALGFYLLICAFTAIGLFMSSLTNYQIVSAIGSFLVFFILTRIGLLWQKYDLIRDLTYFLSLSGRTTKMLIGLVTSKDVSYFILVTLMFIGFTLVKLQSGRESRPWFVSAGRYLGIFLVVLLVGYVTSQPRWTLYWDLTASQRNTLHPRTQKIVKELGDEPLEVTLYTNLFGPGLRQGLPEARNTYMAALWERYIRFKPNISLKYAYYYDMPDGDSTAFKQFPGKNVDQIAREIAKMYDASLSRFTPGTQMRKQIDLAPENFRLVMQLKYKGRTTFLRTFDDPLFWPFETQVAAALKRLLPEPLPKIYHLTGNLERSIYKNGEREFQLHTLNRGYRFALINQGFDTDSLCLDRQDVPADAAAIVLGDPKTVLSERTVTKLRAYLDHGGNMLIFGEPGKQDVVNPVLGMLGVKFLNGTIVQPTVQEMPDMVQSYLLPASTMLAEDDILLRIKERVAEHDTEDTTRIMMPNPVAIDYNSTGPFKPIPFLKTMAPRHTWRKQGVVVTDSAEIVFQPERGDVMGPFSTLVGFTRTVHGHEQRIIVAGDADFISNLRVAGSIYLLNAMYGWLVDNRFPVYAPVPKPKDSLLTITAAGVDLVRIIFVWVLPGLVLATGATLLIRRKRK